MDVVSAQPARRSGRPRAGRGRLGVAATAAAAGVAALMAAMPRLSFDTSLGQLFADDSPTAATFADFDATFGTDDTLLVTVRDAAADPVFRPGFFAAVDRIVAWLEPRAEVAKVVSLANTADYAVLDPGLPPLPRALLPADREAIGDEAEDLRARITGDPLLRHLISADGRAIAIWVLLEPAMRDTADYAARALAIADGLPAPADPTIRAWATGAALLRATAIEQLQRDALWGALAALLVVIAFGAAGGVPARAAVGFTAAWPIVTAALAWGAVAAGRPLHGFSHALAPLLLVTAGATYVHFGRALRRGAATRRSVWLACALATATTAAGFAALTLSDLRPLRALGVEVAAGSALAFAIASAAMRFCCGPPAAAAIPAGSRSGAPLRATGRGAIAVAVLLGAPWFLLVDRALLPLDDPLQQLPAAHPRVADARHAQALFGAPTTLEVVVDLDRDRLLQPSTLLELEAFEQALRASGGASLPFVLGPATLLRGLQHRLLPAAEAALPLQPATAEYAARHLLEPYLRISASGAASASPVVAQFADAMAELVSADGDRLRFGCRVPALAPGALLALTAKLEREVLTPFRATLGARRIYTTGYAVLVAEASVAARNTQLRSVVAIGGLLALLLAAAAPSLRAWWAALLANGLTVVAIANLLVLTGASVSVYSAVLTAALLGVLVDDTVHLLLAVRRAQRNRHPDPVSAGVAAVGGSILLSSVALAAGFATFALSGLADYRQLAWTAPLAIGAALWFDFYLLPRWLQRRPRG